MLLKRKSFNCFFFVYEFVKIRVTIHGRIDCVESDTIHGRIVLSQMKATIKKVHRHIFYYDFRAVLNTLKKKKKNTPTL